MRFFAEAANATKFMTKGMSKAREKYNYLSHCKKWLIRVSGHRAFSYFYATRPGILSLAAGLFFTDVFLLLTRFNRRIFVFPRGHVHYVRIGWYVLYVWYSARFLLFLFSFHSEENIQIVLEDSKKRSNTS